MAIGKPLLVSERKGVQQPVLSAQTQQLSANVPTQKIQFADYRIGQANVQASYAVGNELINMVDAGIKAKMYIDETKREYQRLNLMEEWQQSNIQYNESFAKANTLEAQQEVLDAYSKDNDARTANWRKVMPSTPDSEKYLSAIRTDSQKIHSKFSTTIAQTLNTRTDALEQLNIKRALTDLTTQKNADVVSKMNSIQTSLANRVKIGSLQPEQAEFAYAEAQKGVVAGRVNLFASDFANQNAVSGDVLPEDQDLYQMIENAVGFKIDDPDLLRSAKDSYEDAYYKRIAELNRQDSAEETRAERNMRFKIAAFNAETDEHILSLEGAIPDAEWIKRRVEKAKALDTAWNPGFSRALENKLNQLKWGEANPLQVERYTTGDGRALFPEAFHDLTALEKRLRQISGPEGALNEKTILGIKNYYRSENNKTLKDLGGSTDKILDSVLMGLRADKSVFDVNVLEKGAWDRFTDTLGSMDKVFEQDDDLTQAYQAVKIRLSQLQKDRQGPYSDENRENKSPSEIMDLIAKEAELIARDEFGRVLKEKKAEAKEAKRKLKFELAEQLGPKESEKIQKSRLPKPEAMDSKPVIGRGRRTSEQVRKLAEMQKDENLKRNLEAASKFDAQLQKGDWQGALGTAFATKWQNLTQWSRDAHEQSKITYQQNPTGLNDRKKHLQDMAVMSKNLKQSLVGQIADKLGKAVGQGEEITIDGLANDMSILTGWIGRRFIDGMENEAVEKTPIVDTKAVNPSVPEPRKAEQPPVVDEIVQAVVSGANQLFGAGTDAEAAQGDSNVQGARYLTAEGQPTNVMPLDVRERVLGNIEAYPQFTRYHLRQDDMLGRIAKQAGMSLEALQNLNANTIGRENELEIGEEILLPAGSTMAPSVEEPAQVETAPTPKGQGSAVKNLDTLDTRSKKESKRKFEEIKNLSEKDTILFFEGHPPDAKFQTKGLHEGPYGISLENFNAYTGKKYKVNDKPTPEDVEIAYNAHMEKAVMPIIADLEKYVQFSSNEKRALISLLWNGAKGSKTLAGSPSKPLAPKAYKAFKAGEKAKAYEELFSSTKGIRKGADGKVNQGLVNRRAAEWLLAEMGDASGSSPATNISSVGGATKKAYDLFSDPNTAGQNLEEKLRAIRELVADKEGRVKEELASKELLELQKHLDELMHFKENLALDGQELRTGEIQEKDIENYQLNRNPVYEGKDPQRNRRNI